MTTSSELTEPGAPPVAPPDRRLHPASPVFTLVAQLKRYAVPLVILLLTGRGDRTELWSLGFVVLLVAWSAAHYALFRFRIDRTGVVIREGVFVRSVRHIPFDRIQNVSLNQSLLHRVFGVADVELESAGGRGAEGRMRVLAIEDAQAVESAVRDAAPVAAAAPSGEPAAPAPEPVPLLTLSLGEAARYGIIANRALLIVAAALGVVSQIDSDLLEEIARQWGGRALGAMAALFPAGAQAAVRAAVLAVFVGVAFVGASAALGVLRYHEFTLTDDGQRLRVSRGLFSRLRAALQRRRIQLFTIRESVLHRLFRRRALAVDVLADSTDEDRSLRELAPIAPPGQLDALVAHLLAPNAAWPVDDWRPLHPRAWRRRFTPHAVAVLAIAAFSVWAFGTRGYVALAALVPVFFSARLWARHTSYACERGLVAVRTGWLGRTWRFIEIRKLQSVHITQSPFDRRYGMATLDVDTAGATERAPRLLIPWLAEHDARALRELLLRGVTPAPAATLPAPPAQPAVPAMP